MIDNKKPKKLQWTNKLIGTFWDGVEQTRMKELNFSLLAGSYFLELINNELSKNKQYLDFGSGSGEIVSELIQRGYQIGAYEVSNERRQSLRNSTDIEKYDDFLGYISDESQQTFDTVLMTEVIEHIIPEQLDSVLNVIKSKLRPDGRIIITTPNTEDIGLGICFCPTCNHSFHRWQHVSSFSPTDLENLMKSKGFETKHLHLVDFSMNGELIEENKKLKKQINELQKSGVDKIKELIVHDSPPENHELPRNLRLGAETHILYIGQLKTI